MHAYFNMEMVSVNSALNKYFCNYHFKSIYVIYNAVAPKIVPFSTVALLQRGERVTITCTMAKGDLPLNILWLKDGIPLANTEDERVKILTFDHYNSMLTIESLELRHVGNYTCQAANAAGMASHSQAVLVNGKSLGTKSNWNAPVLACLVLV